jgi:hypothetical protein
MQKNVVSDITIVVPLLWGHSNKGHIFYEARFHMHWDGEKLQMYPWKERPPLAYDHFFKFIAVGVVL